LGRSRTKAIQSTTHRWSPIISKHWHSEDEAFTDVVSGLRKLINEFPLENAVCSAARPKATGNVVAKEAHFSPEHILPDAEREILFESAQDGELHILKVDAFGSWLRAGKKDFFEQTDPAVQARYLDAFESLHRRGFIHRESGTFYRLTGAGFEEARRIAKAKGDQV
jgi:uncharacterized protein YjhX (UPF0386 family)